MVGNQRAISPNPLRRCRFVEGSAAEDSRVGRHFYKQATPNGVSNYTIRELTFLTGFEEFSKLEITHRSVKASQTQSNPVKPNPTSIPHPWFTGGKETVKFLAFFDHYPITHHASRITHPSPTSFTRQVPRENPRAS
jgi:hypothetical protein